MPLSPAQCETYQRDGYLVVDDVLDPAAVAGLRERLAGEQRAVAAAGAERGRHQLEDGGGGAALRKLDEPARRDPLFAAIAATPRILDLVTELTGAGDSGVLLYSDQVFMKPAGSGSPKPLHQDNSYFRIEPCAAGITCWLAIDDATLDNGCLRYVPGSHRRGLLPHRSLTPAHLTPDTDQPLGDEVATPVRAGGCVLHHPLTLHASPANRSPHPRRAYALHYVSGRAQTMQRAASELIRLR